MVAPAEQTISVLLVTFVPEAVGVQQVAMAGSLITETKQIVHTLNLKSERVVLFYSGGKDSLAMLDLLHKEVRHVTLCFMFFVKDLEHIDKYLNYALKRYPNTDLIQVPHFILSNIHKEGLYCHANPKVKLKRFTDVCADVAELTSNAWQFIGWKQSDSLNRRLTLRGYEQQAIHQGVKKCYPLTHWKNKDVLAYLKARKIPAPINYEGKASSGLTFNKQVFEWLQVNYPNDLQRVYQQYPLSKIILGHE